MLCGIRDPYKNLELVVSPEGMEASILPVAVTFSVLVKSKRPLGKDVEGKKGGWGLFRRGSSSVQDVGKVGGDVKDKKGLLRR